MRRGPLGNNFDEIPKPVHLPNPTTKCSDIFFIVPRQNRSYCNNTVDTMTSSNNMTVYQNVSTSHYLCIIHNTNRGEKQFIKTWKHKIRHRRHTE